jgi:hypothetical protein
MIVFTKGNATQQMIVTLNEKRTLSSGYYLFVFTNFTTGESVNKIYNFTEDNSSYQNRFNDFDIATDTLFGDYSVGQWLYVVYEQESSSNTDPAGLTIVEQGVMVLNPAVEFSRDEYNVAKSIKQYNG